MAEDQAQPVGPDLAQGVGAAELPDGGKLVGHVGQEPVLLARLRQGRVRRRRDMHAL